MKKTVPTTGNGTTIIIAGAAGMIGSHLCEALVEMGARVVGLDDLHVGDEKNLKSLRGNPSFDLIETNIAETLPAALFKKDISHIVHVANTISHLGRQDLELSQLLVNSHGTKNLLDLAQKKHARLVYTSSIDIYRGLASHRNLEHYYDGLEVSAYYSFIEAKRYGEALAKEYWDSYGVDIRIARLSQVYGPRMDLDDGSTLARLMRLVLEEKDLVIDEEGSREHLLIYVGDVVYGLTKLLFSDKEEAKGSIFNLANPEHVSTLSIAYTLRELVDEGLKVEFMPAHQGFNVPEPPEVDISRSEKVLFWKPEVDLTEGLERTMRSFVGKEKTEDRKQKTDTREQKTEDAKAREKQISESASLLDSSSPPGPSPPQEKGWLSKAQQAQQKAPAFIKGLHSKKPNVNTTRLKKVFAGAATALFILLLPAFLTAAFAGGAYLNLRAGDFASAKTNFLRAEQIAQFIPQNSIQDLLLAGYFGADVASDFQKAVNELMPLTKDLLASWQEAPSDTPRQSETKLTQQDINTRVTNAQKALWQAQSNFQLMQTQLTQTKPDRLAQFLGLDKRVKKLRETIDNFEPMVNRGTDLAGFLPTLLGYDKSHSFLVLLQNNTELRPTGGFIGSYIVFSLRNGKFARFKVDDIYNPDGRLEQLPEVAQTPAPKAIQKHMGVEYLGARDANWWPDFSRSAPEVIRLYKQATGEEVDTVVGINLSLLQDVLKITGPVYLPDYQEEISTENVVERAEVYSEVGFEPGSEGKKSFLATLAGVLVEQLTWKMGAEKNLWLAQAVATNLKQKDLLFYSQVDDLQKVFADGGWAGKLRQSSGDYLYVVDANVGGNKANFWVRRSTDYSVDVDREGDLTGNLEITWEHTSKSTTWPSGDYKNYLRVYVPQEIELIEASGLQETPAVSCALSAVHCEVAGLVRVPIDTTKTVSLRYKLPQNSSFSQRDDYELLIQKQPGVEAERVKFSLNLPTFLSSPVQTEREFTLDEDKSLSLPVSDNEVLKKGRD